MATVKELHFEQRCVIKFLTLEGKPPHEIHDRLGAVYGPETLSSTAVKFWAAETRRGRKSLQDEARSGRPSDITTQENIEQIEKLVMSDRRLKVVEIAAECKLSIGTVERILHDHLHLSKVAARWVPRNLSTVDMKNRVECSRQILAHFEKDEEMFLQRLVTGDETWLRHWDPETKQESKQWKHATSPPPKKFRSQPTAGKIMGTIFWDSRGIIMIDYLEDARTITGDYYANLMWKLREQIKRKRRGMLTRGVLLLHDNAPPHRAHVATTAIQQCGFTEVNHPPYSPDLAPSDYFLFPNLKKELRGRRFMDNSDVKSAVEGYFSQQDKNFYLTGLRALKLRCEKCVAIEGCYVEK